MHASQRCCGELAELTVDNSSRSQVLATSNYRDWHTVVSDCSALHVCNVKCASFLFGSVPLGPNFMGTGSSPAKMLIPFDRYCSWSRYNFYAKNVKYGYLNPILEKLGWHTTLVDGSLESPWSSFCLRCWTFFAIYYGSEVYCSFFEGGRPLCIQLLSGQGHAPIAYTPLAKLALPCAVIKFVKKSSRVNFNRKNNTLSYQVTL